ncbi:MAG: hypothetical protein KatS3mg077_1180 [Candidatus Binatia bacterium]|nr:MAG: hypothetical protein KatS3mg077_1180 [Candidatus Binatia bacterium]
MDSLCDERGDVRFGLFEEAVAEVDFRRCRLIDEFDRPASRWRRHFGFKQFEFLGGLSEQVVFGCALVNIRYAASAFVYAYWPRERKLEEYNFLRPLEWGVRMDPRPEDGRAVFVAGHTTIQTGPGSRPGTRHLRADIPGKALAGCGTGRRRSAHPTPAHLYPSGSSRLGLCPQNRWPAGARRVAIDDRSSAPGDSGRARPPRLECGLHASRHPLALGLPGWPNRSRTGCRAEHFLRCQRNELYGKLFLDRGPARKARLGAFRVGPRRPDAPVADGVRGSGAASWTFGPRRAIASACAWGS